MARSSRSALPCCHGPARPGALRPSAPFAASARCCNAVMHSTVRIDDDLMIALDARARAESVSLTRVINRTLRAGLGRPGRDGSRTRPFVQKTFAMGRPKVDLDRASELAARLEDE